MIGVVIPALDEEQLLPALLADLRRVVIPLDVVVVDGGSRDATARVAAAGGARVVASGKRRAAQLNAGAAVARGSWLLFLHADSRLPGAARRALLTAVTNEPDLAWAVFRFAIDVPGFWGGLITAAQRVRQRVLRLPYGDQGLLVRRDLFDSVGGFPDLPLMEDVALVRRLRRHAPLRTLPASLVTSGRRYAARGVVRTWLLHGALLVLYGLGVSPARLARWRARR
jgi:rSAM/selenodomain-associated transferase 2